MLQEVAIDGPEFAHEARSLSGEIPLADLPRLADLLLGTEGSVSYVLHGSIGRRQEPLLAVSIKGSLPLLCQRCMEQMDFALDVDVLFELKPGGGDLELTQEEVDDDSRDVLPVDGDIDVLELIEDEVLLALPVAPRHDVCKASLQDDGVERPSPFAALATLKKH